jgi:hypothetical protein
MIRGMTVLIIAGGILLVGVPAGARRIVDCRQRHALGIQSQAAQRARADERPPRDCFMPK